MVKKRGTRSDDPIGSDAGVKAVHIERLTNLAALLLVKGEPQGDQLRTLTQAGFSNTEIPRLLGLSPNAVNVALHRMRKRT